MQPFKLINVAKYSKSHYSRTDSIWYDLALCLHADGYGPFFGYSHDSKRTPQEECFSERKGITSLIASRIRNNTNIFTNDNRVSELISNISPDDCFRCGYYTKGHRFVSSKDEDLPDYDYWEAVVRAHLSELSNTTCDQLGYDNWDLFQKNNIPELFKLQRELKGFSDEYFSSVNYSRVRETLALSLGGIGIQRLMQLADSFNESLIEKGYKDIKGPHGWSIHFVAWCQKQKGK